MWSGPPQWAQWALNPSAYQGMSNDQVDWARLAQQWIMMKETTGPSRPEPPAPGEGPEPDLKLMGEEGGEAPMDIGKDEDGDNENDSAPTQGGPRGSTEVTSWNETGWSGGNSWQQQQQWGNFNNYPLKNGVEGGGQFGFSNTASNYEYSTDSISRGENYAQGGGYWPDGNIMPHGSGPMPFVRGGMGRHNWDSKGKGPRLENEMQISDEEEETEPVIDAAKRRTLPIWIREGLEKMEREKQKKIEREKMELNRKEAMKKRLLEEQEALNELRAEKGLPPKSKFDSDSDGGSDKEDDENSTTVGVTPAPVIPEVPSKRKSRFHDGPIPGMDMKPPVRSRSPPKLTKEELMMRVRRTMTEVLLDVTTSELLATIQETLAKARNKAPAKQLPQKKTVAVASLKANLGLAMYGSGSEDDGGGNSSSDSEDDTQGSDSGDDTDTQLKEKIRQRQQEFEVQEREIQAQAAAAEEREKLKGHQAASSTHRRFSLGSTGEGGTSRVEEQEGAADTVNSKDLTSRQSRARQVETEVVARASHDAGAAKESKNGLGPDDSAPNHKDGSSIEISAVHKSNKKKKSDSSNSSDESTSSSKSSKRKHKRKRKERRKEKHRSKERGKKRRDRSSSPRRDKKVRDQSPSPDRKNRDRSSSSARRKSRDEKKRRQRSESRSRRSRSRSIRRDRSSSRSRRGRSRSRSPGWSRRDRSVSKSRWDSSRSRRDRSTSRTQRRQRRRSRSSESDQKRRRRTRSRSRSRSGSPRRRRRQRSSSRSSSGSEKRHDRSSRR